MNAQHRVGSALILAVCLALIPGQNAVHGQRKIETLPEGENSIAITVVDTTTTFKSANLAGTFTTKKGVTLTSVKGYAFPVSGGIVSTGGGSNQNPAVVIDDGKKIYTSVIVNEPALTAQTYAFRVDGTFSDGSVMHSAYFSAKAGGDVPSNNVTVNWTTGFPKSTASKEISSEGDYTGDVDKTSAAFVFASKAAGGPTEAQGGIAFGPIFSTWAANQKVGSGGTYAAVSLMNEKNGKTYCSTIANVTTMP